MILFIQSKTCGQQRSMTFSNEAAKTGKLKSTYQTWKSTLLQMTRENVWPHQRAAIAAIIRKNIGAKDQCSYRICGTTAGDSANTALLGKVPNR